MKVICDYCEGYDFPDEEGATGTEAVGYGLKVNFFDVKFTVCLRCLKKTFDVTLLPREVPYIGE